MLWRRNPPYTTGPPWYRGDGSICQRHASGCPNRGQPRGKHEACACSWEIAFYFRGKRIREHGGRSEREAKRKLRARIKAIRGGRYVDPDEEPAWLLACAEAWRPWRAYAAQHL